MNEKNNRLVNFRFQNPPSPVLIFEINDEKQSITFSPEYILKDNKKCLPNYSTVVNAAFYLGQIQKTDTTNGGFWFFSEEDLIEIQNKKMPICKKIYAFKKGKKPVKERLVFNKNNLLNYINEGIIKNYSRWIARYNLEGNIPKVKQKHDSLYILGENRELNVGEKTLNRIDF